MEKWDMVISAMMDNKKQDNQTKNKLFYQELQEFMLNFPPLEVMDNFITINKLWTIQQWISCYKIK